MSSLKQQLIRLGKTNPDLRNHLRPILDVVTASLTEADEERIFKKVKDVLRGFRVKAESDHDMVVSDDGYTYAVEWRPGNEIFAMVSWPPNHRAMHWNAEPVDESEEMEFEFRDYVNREEKLVQHIKDFLYTTG